MHAHSVVDPVVDPVVETFGEPARGSILTVLGGVHGDEPEGVLAAGMLADALAGRALKGAVRIVRVANPAAFSAGERTAPGDDNLARVFPGRPDGSPAERAARAITDHAIAGSDLVVDLHSAGRHYVMPQFAGFDAGAPTADRSHAAALAFGAPLIWEHPSIAPGRSLSAAAELGVPAIYVEGHGGGGVLRRDLDGAVTGLLRLLGLLGILHADLPAPRQPRRILNGDGNVDDSVTCTVEGFCATRVELGDEVAAGDPVVDIFDARGVCRETVRARAAGTVMMLRRTAPVSRGEKVAMIAEVERR